MVEVDVVRDGRRYSPVCSEPCCPSEGVAVPGADEVPAVAELVALGRAPLADREAVDRLVDPDPVWSAHLSAPLAEATREPRRRRRDAVRAWASLLDRDPGRAPAGGAPPGPPRLVADAVAGLRDIALRDALIGWLAPSVLPRDALDPPVLALLERRMPRWAGMGSWQAGPAGDGERELLLDRLVALCRCVPDDRPGDAAAACSVAAQVAWSTGDGARARAALDRALRLDPGYRLAMLLAQVVDHGLRLDQGPTRPASRAGRLRPPDLRTGASRAAGRTVRSGEVMSPSAKPRFAGRQPSSRWGAPGDDPAAAPAVASASARGVCDDRHPDPVDRRRLASR